MGLVGASSAAAQDGTDTGGSGSTDVGKQVDQDVKGTVGLGLIGLEIGLLMPGATGLTETWAWSVFPAIGAIGGVVAGIFIFDQADPSEARAKGAVASLALGIGLAIPAAVGGLALASKREASREYASLREQRRMAAARAGTGLVRLSPEGTFVAAPGIAPMVGRTASGRRDRGTLVSLFSGRF